MTPDSIESSARRLIEWFDQLDDAVIAFSGGVDSAVVAFAAFQSLGARACAITGIGPALSLRDKLDAEQVAKSIGIRHLLLQTDEIDDPDYQANLGRRCFYCKSRLFVQLRQWASEHDCTSIVTGTNADDLHDYRPGLQAAEAFQVLSPLANLGYGKSTIRDLAHHWSIPIAEKPASPCLASRIAPGVRVTREKLAIIEEAEAWLRAHQISDVRVRWLPEDVISVEVPLDELEEASQWMPSLCRKLLDHDLKQVRLDPLGLRSGWLSKLHSLPLPS